MSGVAITGIGCYSSIGKNIEEFEQNLFYKDSETFYPIDEIDCSKLRNNRSSYIKDLDNNKTKTGSRAAISLLKSVDEAIKNSRAKELIKNNRKVGISLSNSIGGISDLVSDITQGKNFIVKKSLNRFSKNSKKEKVLNIPNILLLQDVLNKYKTKGPVCSSLTACSAGGNAIEVGFKMIKDGICDMVIVCGVDPLSEISLFGFNALKALSKDTLRSLDAERDGMLLGESAGCIILEREDAAEKRGAPIYGKVLGSGISNDAFHITQPDPEGNGAVFAMNKALKESSISFKEIDYVNIHGTGTKYNDLMELNALESVFGNDLPNTPINSSKTKIGHTLGTAGVIEAIICMLTLKNQAIHPHSNFSNRIDREINYNVNTELKPMPELKYIMSNSFGFGGNCASVIFGSYDGGYSRRAAV